MLKAILPATPKSVVKTGTELVLITKLFACTVDSTTVFACTIFAYTVGVITTFACTIFAVTIFVVTPTVDTILLEVTVFEEYTFLYLAPVVPKSYTPSSVGNKLLVCRSLFLIAFITLAEPSGVAIPNSLT